jgi:AcrR family transcriptional regulator
MAEDALLTTSNRVSFPTRQAAAARNRDKILIAAQAAFADPSAQVSMAEIARRAGVGMATLYRNFPGRRELLEALYVDEVDALCEAAGTGDAQTRGAALTTWLRRLIAFLPHKRLIVSELLEHTDRDSPVIHGNRARALAAGRPLLAAAQDVGEIRDDLTIEQIFDMIAAIAKIHGDPRYLEPMFQTMLDGLQLSTDDNAEGPARP